MNKQTWKKVLVGGLTVAMLTTGASSAFADNKGRGKGNDKDDWKKDKKKAELTLNIKIDFDDLKGGDVEWALRHIASLASKRVFEGYEDGTFQPRKAINRIEAITAAVRLMDLKEEAEAKMDTELNFKDADKIKSKYPWAVGYVAVAVENDLFLETDESVQPEKSADRLWATMLLIKALKLDDEAKAKMNTQLEFKDAGSIPAGAVGYVALAVEKGLVSGYENNTFRPNQPVTRAELAALLDRTGSQMPDADQYYASGEITAVNSDTITIKKNGNTVQYEFHDHAIILRDNVKITASQLAVGDEVRLNFVGNQVIFVEVKEQADDELYSSGEITAVTNSKITIKKNGDTAQYEFHDDVVFLRDNVRVTASQLVVGDKVKLSYNGNEVILVEVTEKADANGEFSVRGTFNSLTVNSSGQIATISVTHAVYSGTETSVYNVANDVDIDGNASLLTPNRDITVKGSNNIVDEIDIH